MDEPCNRHIRETFDMVRRMIILADEGEQDSTDDSCVVLYGIIRDSAYRIKAEAERERSRHVEKGTWAVPAEEMNENTE